MEYVKRSLRYAVCLVAVMLLVMLAASVDVSAVSETDRSNYGITEGVTESTVYVTDSEGVNIRAHILRIQNGADATIRATTSGYYASASTVSTRKTKAGSWNTGSWGFDTLRNLAKAYDASAEKTGTVIAASNGDFYNEETGVPIGVCIAEGNTLQNSAAEPFFAVLNNGSYVIRYAGESTADVREAIGGRDLLVDGGANTVGNNTDKTREPRQGIGVCADGAVVIVNVDGREPASVGATVYDFAEILRQQGCVRAINFDGGGSATFLTKRPGDASPVYRNTKGDGFERKVSTSLLVVSSSNSVTASGASTVSMKNSSTVLNKKSGVWNYKVNGKKADGFYAVNGKCYLFRKGKGLSKKVKVGDATYTFKKGALSKSSDKKAGKVIIGYCGAASGGKNLLYAYHYGDKLFKVGLNPMLASRNGKMKNWKKKANIQQPWYSVRSEIKKIYIGDGVTTIGEKFMYLYEGPVFDGTPALKGKLTTVRLPSSLKSIGSLAFYNKPKLKNLVIPEKVTTVGSKAFGYTGTGYIEFKSAKVPKFGSNAFKSTKFTQVRVRNNSAWKKFVKAKKFKKLGYKKSVKYK